MVERRSPKPSVEVRFLVGPQTRKIWSAPDFFGLREAERCFTFRKTASRGRGIFERRRENICDRKESLREAGSRIIFSRKLCVTDSS